MYASAHRLRTAVAALLVGCGQAKPQAADPQPSSDVRASSAVTLESPPLPSWSDGALVGALLAGHHVYAELARDDDDAELRADLLAHERLRRVEAAGSLARIDGPDAYESLKSVAARWPEDAGILAALGLLDVRAEETESLEQSLWLRYALASRADARRGALFTLARQGGVKSQALLAGEAVAENDSEDASAVFEAMGILCARGIAITKDGARATEQAMAAGSGQTRHAALYSFGRCAEFRSQGIPAVDGSGWQASLQAAVNGSDAEASRLAWKAYGALGQAPESIPDGLFGTPGAPWLVEAEAARTLSADPKARRWLIERLRTLPLETFHGPRSHGLLVALQGLRSAIAHQDLLWERLVPLANRIENDDVTVALSAEARELVRCELRLLRALTDGDIGPVETCNTDASGLPKHYGRRLAAEAIVHMGPRLTEEARAKALVAYAQAEETVVAAYALSALAELDHPSVNGILREALTSADIGVLAAAAGAVAVRAVDERRRDPEAVNALASVIQRVDNDHAIEARLGAIEALAALAKGSENSRLGAFETPSWLTQSVVPLLNDPHVSVRRVATSALESFADTHGNGRLAQPQSQFAVQVREATDAFRSDDVTGLRLHTRAGTIEISFGGAPAPVAQATLVALARQGYFDGLRWHRVIPGFVVQGGDPRGDGYGGPGWVVPCERSDIRFERGTVGMALAGKDTGGSQIFITHTRQPHLDGRFTVIGQIVGGLDVVDAILPYDVISRAELVRGPRS